MSYDHPSEDWTKADIDHLLKLLPIIEAPDFVPCTWFKQAEQPNTISMAFPKYHPVVERLLDVIYNTSAYIDPYAALPEDQGVDVEEVWPSWTNPEPERFEAATLNQVRRYLVLCTRGERFCNGHIASQFESGAMLAAFRRLRQIASR